jgi:hypothetical protein
MHLQLRNVYCPNNFIQLFALFWMLYALLWVIPRRLNFICRMYMYAECIFHTYLPIKMEQSVPKRQCIKFRRRGITQKKAYKNFVQCVYVNSKCI